MNCSARTTLTAALAVALIFTACQVRRAPAPVSVALLKVGPPTRLTDRAALSPVAWAPDGQALAYSDAQGLWVVSLAGRERKVTAVGVATQVDWSRPTGLLAYIDRGDIMVVRSDGTKRQRISLPVSQGRPAFATRLVWAPGSDRMAVAVRESGGTDRNAVWLVSADGASRRRVFEAPPGQTVAALEWFPDSLYLFIGLAPEGAAGVSRLLRWRIAYPDRRILPQPFLEIIAPHLSPNGRWIAFVASAGRGADADHVWAVRVDGSGQPRRLSGDAKRITSLAWAPASEAVAFARVLDDSRGEVWVADVEGGGRVRVAEFVAEFPDPNLPLVVRWSRDGRHLAFGSNSGSYTGPVWVVRLDRR